MNLRSRSRRGGPGRLASLLGSTVAHGTLLGLAALLGIARAAHVLAEEGQGTRVASVEPWYRSDPLPSAEREPERPIQDAAPELPEPEPRPARPEPAAFLDDPPPRPVRADDLDALELAPESLELVRPAPELAGRDPVEPAVEPAPDASPAAAPTPSEPGSGPPADAGGGEPILLDAPEPAYPRLSARFGEQGVVTCLLHVDAEGRVRGVDVLASSGFPRLDAAAVDALAAWRFQPARVDGRPAPSTYRHRVRFELSSPRR